jgi:putative phage-type endonuclease
MRGKLESFNTRQEWLAARDRDLGIGASEVAQILGVSPFGGPWDLWTRKLHGVREEQTEDQASGILWEPVVLYLYGQTTGRDAKAPDRPTLLRHAEHPWLLQSPDAWTQDGELRGQVEAKRMRFATGWGEPCTITPGWEGAWPCPAFYAVQCYVQLEVSGLDFVDLVALLPSYDLRIYRILPDPELQAQIVAQVREWRDRHLIAAVEPPVDDSEAAWSYYASRDHAAPLREATEEERALALELARVQRELKAAEGSERRLKNELGQRLQGCAGVTLGPSPGGRRKPPRIAWEGGGTRTEEARPARTYTVAPHLRVRGITEEESP